MNIIKNNCFRCLNKFVKSELKIRTEPTKVFKM